MRICLPSWVSDLAVRFVTHHFAGSPRHNSAKFASYGNLISQPYYLATLSGVAQHPTSSTQKAFELVFRRPANKFSTPEHIRAASDVIWSQHHATTHHRLEPGDILCSVKRHAVAISCRVLRTVPAQDGTYVLIGTFRSEDIPQESAWRFKPTTEDDRYEVTLV